MNNSLEFIKQHVAEWPSNSEQVILCTDGDVIFANSKSPTPVHRVDLSEHFAPSYYDGKVWTREEFEACGVVESTSVSKVNRDIERTTSIGVDATVEERGNRYGTFKDGADIMQELKSVMRSTPNWSNLTPSQREALEMIQHKVGRVLNGDPNYTDSWHDIKGYAHLIEEELNGNVK